MKYQLRDQLVETPQIADEPRASARGRLNNEFDEVTHSTVGGGTIDLSSHAKTEVLRKANYSLPAHNFVATVASFADC